MNPKDIMTDAIHNFHPQYQQYTQYSSGMYTILNCFPHLILFTVIIVAVFVSLLIVLQFCPCMQLTMHY